MIGICMKYFEYTYGGMLQAQALCYFLEMNGAEYELIRYKKKDSFLKKISYLPRLLNRYLLHDKKLRISKKIAKMKDSEFAEKDKMRRNAFDRYCKKIFNHLSEEYIGYSELMKGASKYEVIVSGSDQLWSPAGLPTNFYNLMFVPDHIRKVSIASSFGVDSIPVYQRKRTKRFLERIEYLSVRENRGKEIVFELTGREVPVLLDPVFFLTKNDWDNLIERKSTYEDEYIFAYFLGTNGEYREVVREFAKEKGLKIVGLPNMDQYVVADRNFADIELYDCEPDYFLNVLRNAKYVFTDSFHGVVFSVLYEKKFLVFNRYSEGSKISKNSRIDSLCQNLGLENRRFTGNIVNIDKDVNYDEVKDIVEVMRKESIEFIREALG